MILVVSESGANVLLEEAHLVFILSGLCLMQFAKQWLWVFQTEQETEVGGPMKYCLRNTTMNTMVMTNTI